MPQQIKIVPNTPRTPTQPGKFSPQAASSFGGDNITWFNGDSEEHWPAPNISDKTAWVRQVIKPGTPGNGSVAPALYTTVTSTVTSANPAVLTLVAPFPKQGDKVSLSYSGTDTGWQAAVQAVPPGSAVAASGSGNNQFTVAGLNGAGLAPFTGKITLTLPYTLNYICVLHPDEKGSINIQA